MAVENTDLLRWQELSREALGEFLAAAMAEDLPAIAWTIATSGAMTGTVDSLTTDAKGQRAAFDAWAHRLDAEPTERTDSAGVTHLYAPFTWPRNHLVAGALRASIVPAMDDEAAE
jgi:hypothetical protein